MKLPAELNDLIIKQYSSNHLHSIIINRQYEKLKLITNHTRIDPKYLQLALLIGDTNLVDLILQKNNIVNVQCNFGITPMYVAITCGNIEMMKILIKHGATFEAKTDSGVDLVSLVYSTNNRFAISLLGDYKVNTKCMVDINRV
jgi:ankyrin repeat protein